MTDTATTDWKHEHGLVAAALQETAARADRLTLWVADLQSGMFINCVYCGHQYGPREDTPVAMADVLKAHIEKCPEHPLSKALQDNAALRTMLQAAGGMLTTLVLTAEDVGLDVETVEHMEALADTVNKASGPEAIKQAVELRREWEEEQAARRTSP